MAKCILNNLTKVITRVSDEKAKQIVEANRSCVYCSKELWKEYKRRNPTIN